MRRAMVNIAPHSIFRDNGRWHPVSARSIPKLVRQLSVRSFPPEFLQRFLDSVGDVGGSKAAEWGRLAVALCPFVSHSSDFLCQTVPRTPAPWGI